MICPVKVARWTIANMQAPDGHFYYRIYPLMKAKTPMLHWAQATMFKGLTVLQNRLRGDVNGIYSAGQKTGETVVAL